MENKYYISFHRNMIGSQTDIGYIFIKMDYMCKYLGMFGKRQVAKWIAKIRLRGVERFVVALGVSF